jgi:hypothetical protein
MGGGVVGVAVLAAKLRGDPTATRGGQDEQELLEVRPVALGVPVRDPRGTLAADALALPLSITPVPAAEADAGGVVVELARVEVDSLGGGDDHLGEQRATIGLTQPIERPSAPRALN